MRKEVENWWDLAKRDLISAENSFNSGDYYIAAFLCQQAVEKALKALYILEKKETQPVSHSLLFLAQKISFPRKYFDFIRELTPAYINTLYPDVEII